MTGKRRLYKKKNLKRNLKRSLRSLSLRKSTRNDTAKMYSYHIFP